MKIPGIYEGMQNGLSEARKNKTCESSRKGRTRRMLQLAGGEEAGEGRTLCLVLCHCSAVPFTCRGLLVDECGSANKQWNGSLGYYSGAVSCQKAFASAHIPSSLTLPHIAHCRHYRQPNPACEGRVRRRGALSGANCSGSLCS